MVLLALVYMMLGAQPPTPQPPPPPNIWPEYFNPETPEEKVDTDTETDQDVIIMEEDEDSEEEPGNPQNPNG